MNEYGKDGEVLGLVVGYSGEISSDVYRAADLVAIRLASKLLEYARTSASIAKAMRTQRICSAWVHSFARGFAPVILDRVRDNPDQAPGSRNRGSELGADAELHFFYPPSAGEGRS
jgi:predicted GNAT superfamily acetyltransferase